MNLFTVFFAKCEKNGNGLTAGKIYSVVSLPQSDLILTDGRKLEPIPAVGVKCIGMVKMRTTRDLHDPAFHNLLDTARHEFCAAMQPYYS